MSIYNLNNKIIKRFHFDKINKKNIRLKYINVNKILDDKNKLKKMIIGLKKIDYCIPLINLNEFEVFKQLKKCKIKTIYVGHNSQPNSSLNLIRLLNRILRVKKYPIYFKNVINYILLKLQRKYYPDFMILNQPKNKYVNNKIINAHTLDYETYLRNRKKSKPNFIPKGNYLVFLADTPWGGQDFKLLNFNPISKKKYKDFLNKFFSNLEQKLNYKIIISAHPRQTKLDNIFHPRKIISDDTEQLIKYSKGLICHFSGAISYAILNSKPICFFYQKDWKNNDYFSYNISRYQSVLNTKFNLLDDQCNCEKLKFFYDKKIYNLYIKKYLSYNKNNKFMYWDEIIKQVEAS